MGAGVRFGTVMGDLFVVVVEVGSTLFRVGGGRLMCKLGEEFKGWVS